VSVLPLRHLVNRLAHALSTAVSVPAPAASTQKSCNILFILYLFLLFGGKPTVRAHPDAPARSPDTNRSVPEVCGMTTACRAAAQSPGDTPMQVSSRGTVSATTWFAQTPGHVNKLPNKRPVVLSALGDVLPAGTRCPPWSGRSSRAHSRDIY